MELSPPKDFSHFYSKETQRTERSLIKKFYKYFVIPGIGNLAGGLPSPDYFPFETLEARVAQPDRFKPYQSGSRDEATHTKYQHSRLTVPHYSSDPERTRKIDLATGLEYGIAEGYPPLVSWIREFALTKMHPHIPYQGGANVVLTGGTTDGFSKAVRVLTNVWDEQRDWNRDREGVLCEQFAYMTAIQAVKPRGLNVIPVAVDEDGMMAEGPGGLREILENWDKSKGKIPHLMYTITIGQNPCSCLLPIGRRKQIYALCQQYDILIMEDEPYWFLQYPSANELSIQHRGKPVSNSYPPPPRTAQNSSGSPFLDSLVPSYLSIDVDGRVIRFDTFSKMVAPGCRMGWITAQPEIIDKLLAYTDLATMQPNGFVQTMIAELLIGQPTTPEQANDKKSAPERIWHVDGWIRWLEGLRGNYERRMQTMSQILEAGKYQVSTRPDRSSRRLSESDDFELISKTQMYDFAFPMAGMFLWMRVHYESHPVYNAPGITDEKIAWAFWVFLTTEPYRVLVAPGSMFSPTEKVLNDKGWACLRFCFAAVNLDVLESTTQSFVRAANDFFDITDPKVIEDIVREEGVSAGEELEGLKTQMNGLAALNPFMC